MSRHALLFGASGFIGAHVRAALEEESSVEWVTSVGRDRCDLTAATVDDLTSLLRELTPNVVVNCTGRLDGTGYELMQANTMVAAKLIDAVERAVDGVTLRVFNPIGSGLRGETLLGRAVGRLRDALADGADAITMGPLSAYRDFVDARDVATAVVAATRVPSLPVRVVNVGSGRAVTAREAVDLLAHAAGFTGEVREEGAPSARSAAVDWIRADITRAAEVLGWRPTHDLTDSVQAMWTARATAGVGGHR